MLGLAHTAFTKETAAASPGYSFKHCGVCVLLKFAWTQRWFKPSRLAVVCICWNCIPISLLSSSATNSLTSTKLLMLVYGLGLAGGAGTFPLLRDGIRE